MAAVPPKVRFQDLKPDTQKRKLAWYKNHQGLDASTVKRRYNRGTLGPQTATRGHSNTPEKPERAVKSPGKYQAYETKKLGIADRIQDFKRSKWGHRPKYNEERSKMAVRKDPGTGKWRGVKDLNVILAMCGVAIVDTWMDWWAIVALDEDYENAFYYH
jgi:hypothetical protein